MHAIHVGHAAHIRDQAMAVIKKAAGPLLTSALRRDAEFETSVFGFFCFFLSFFFNSRFALTSPISRRRPPPGLEYFV